MEPLEGRGPELSSIAATVEEVLRRVTAIAEETADLDADGAGPASGALNVSAELFEVERALQEAARRLVTLSDALR
jgi:hypothetical protein